MKLAVYQYPGFETLKKESHSGSNRGSANNNAEEEKINAGDFSNQNLSASFSNNAEIAMGLQMDQTELVLTKLNSDQDLNASQNQSQSIGRRESDLGVVDPNQ